MAEYMLTAKQVWQNQEMRNVFYYATQDETTAGLQAIVDGLRAAWATNLQSVMHQNWSLYAFDVRKVDVAGQPTVQYSMTSGVLLGGAAGDPLPAQIALLVSFTALTSKPNKARTYLAGLTETSLGSGLWTSGAITGAQNWADATFDPTSGTITGVARLTVEWAADHSYVLGGNILTARQVGNIPATQRRRRIGVGI